MVAVSLGGRARAGGGASGPSRGGAVGALWRCRLSCWGCWRRFKVRVLLLRQPSGPILAREARLSSLDSAALPSARTDTSTPPPVPMVTVAFDGFEVSCPATMTEGQSYQCSVENTAALLRRSGRLWASCTVPRMRTVRWWWARRSTSLGVRRLRAAALCRRIGGSALS